MKTYGQFRSNRFPTFPGEDEETNPGVFGKSLAEWFADGLRSRDIPVEEVLAEDFAWLVMVGGEPFRLFIACTSTSDLGKPVEEWQAFVRAEPSIIQRMFKRINTSPATQRVCDALAEMLDADGDINDIRWSEE